MSLRDDALGIVGIVAALGVCARLELGNAAPSPPPPSVFTGLLDLFQWTFNGQAYVYNTSVARTTGSPLNPANSYVHLATETLTGELRPNIQAKSTYLDLEVQPRFTSVYQAVDVPTDEFAQAYLQTGFIRVKPAANVSVTFGRQLLTWGPAIFRSPSNPYYFNNERTNPILELSGIDVASVSYSAGQKWTLGGGVVIGSGHDLVADNVYRGSTFLKADFHGASTLASLVLAEPRGESAFIGGYAQATVNDATLLYGEFNSSTTHTGLRVLPAGAVPAYGTDLPSRRAAVALVGGSYTFNNGDSLDAEYLYNGFGYSGSVLSRFFRQSRGAESALLNDSPYAGLEAAAIGEAAGRSRDLLGQHYLYVQLQNNPSQGNTLWRLMAAHNLVDHSSQLSGYVEQNVATRVSLFALGIADLGAVNAEFGAVFRYSLLVGVKLFLF